MDITKLISFIFFAVLMWCCAMSLCVLGSTLMTMRPDARNRDITREKRLFGSFPPLSYGCCSCIIGLIILLSGIYITLNETEPTSNPIIIPTPNVDLKGGTILDMLSTISF